MLRLVVLVPSRVREASLEGLVVAVLEDLSFLPITAVAPFPLPLPVPEAPLFELPSPALSTDALPMVRLELLCVNARSLDEFVPDPDDDVTDGWVDEREGEGAVDAGLVTADMAGESPPVIDEDETDMDGWGMVNEAIFPPPRSPPETAVALADADAACVFTLRYLADDVVRERGPADEVPAAAAAEDFEEEDEESGCRGG